MRMIEWIVYVCSYERYIVICVVYFFFFKQKTAYEMRISDWSSDVCSSDLLPLGDELGWNLGNAEPEEIFHLARGDDDRDSCGEPGDHRMGYVLDHLTQADDAGGNQDQPSKDRCDHQAIVALLRNDVENDDDEGPGGAANMDARTAERRNQKTRANRE